MNETPQRHPFLDDLAEGVTLISSVLRRPVSGRDAVREVVKAAGSHYRRQTPRFLGTLGVRTFFEYEAELADGSTATGLVAITKDEAGAVTALNITFSPLGAVLAIAEALRERFPAVLDGDPGVSPASP